MGREQGNRQPLPGYIHMELGQPATAAPRAARLAAARALESEPLGYTLALGLDPRLHSDLWFPGDRGLYWRALLSTPGKFLRQA